MKKFIISVLFLFAGAGLFAQTDSISFSEKDFSSSVTSDFNISRFYYEEESEPESFSQFVFELVLELLWFQNYCVYYDDYPFKDDTDYIKYSFTPELAKGRPYHFALEGAFYYFPESKTLGNELRFEGTFWHFFGPVIENQLFTKLTDENNYGHLKLGGSYHIFQTNPLSLTFFIQWSHLYGSWKDDGVNLGLIIKSYIARTVLLEFRMCFSDYDSGEAEGDYEYDPDTIAEIHFEAGFMISGPYELYVAYKSVQDGIHQTDESAVSVGLKRYF